MLLIAAISQLALMLAFAVHMRREHPRFVALAGLALVASLYLVGVWARWEAKVPGGFTLFWVGAALLLPAVWILTEALTTERFRFLPRHGGLIGGCVLAHLAGAAVEAWAGVPRFLFLTNMALVAVLAVAILARTVADYRRQRPSLKRTRRARLLALLTVAVLGIGIGYAVTPSTLSVWNVGLDLLSATFGAGAFYFNLHLLRVDPRFAASGREAPAEVAATSLSARVLAAMETERLYLSQELTAVTFAAAVGAAEEAVRSVIMKELGFTNFNDFVNHYRVAEAVRRLRDPAQAHVKIAAIAFDCGFNSLSPFNRAFKAAHGQTPSQFREQVA